MALTLVTAPTSEPVTLAEVKAHLRITAADEDGLLAGYMLAARSHVERLTRRSLLTQVWDLTFDEWPDCIVLPMPPTISVGSVTYVDGDGTTQTLAADQYRLLKLDTGEWGIVPAYNVIWPLTRTQMSAITVRFTAGYGSLPGSIPEPLRQAMLLLIGHWYANREAVIVGTIVSESPMAFDALVFPFRVFY